ncbi:MFS transporter [Pedobacter petrophilus]|uniref:MFS transporter n=1 Tax=Pedobacter petrophilus TaxID=1908241 RepID=A0A7K0FXG4_9SPHI|nr:MFS transporter [Pedobacter petrophilus]MRX76278.1 MFS transporter [Pedobacter petrophilus]
MERKSATKKRSLNFLNWLNFSAADVATGLGPFLAVYLAANLKWNPSQIGIAIGAMSLATVIAQSPAGWLCDVSDKKRLGIIVVTITICLAGFCMLFFPNFYAVIACQIAIGVAAAFFGPVLIALAMGIGGSKQFDQTISRNQTFNHAGNVASAIIIGLLGKFTHNEGIFYGLAIFCFMSIIFTLSIKEKDISHVSTDEQPDENRSQTSIGEMLKNKGYVVLLVSAILFHFANAAMLPLVGQELGKDEGSNASLYMSACIVLAQAVMVPIAFMSDKWARNGRRKLMIIAFLMLPIRGILYTLAKGAPYLVSIQVLDGIAGGIFSIVAILMVADIFRGSGKENFAQGMMATSVGIGASLSNVTSGFIVKNAGFNFGMLILSAIALVAFVVFWRLMPETIKQSGHFAEKEKVALPNA